MDHFDSKGEELNFLKDWEKCELPLIKNRKASFSYYSPSMLKVEVEQLLTKQEGNAIIMPFTYTIASSHEQAQK